MQLTYIPLLAKLRELYRLPRDMDRFRAYLREMVAADGQDVDFPPLVIANPMAREHVAALLDDLLAIDADGVAAEAAFAAAAELLGDERFCAALTIADDLRGGWTNRWAVEYQTRFEADPRGQRHWVAGILWSSEPGEPDILRDRVRLAIRTAVFRTDYLLRHGIARTLRERLAQEGEVLRQAGGPLVESLATINPDELDYTRTVLEPLLDSTDMATTVACLFGDDAARTLGFRCHGLSPYAGLAWAVCDIQHLCE